MTTIPEIRELSPTECERILARNHVCRMAFSFRDRVDIEPLGYVYEDGWLYGRTSPGAKLATIAHHRWVAVEVDEIAGPLAWRSVVVRGTFYLLEANGSAQDRELYAHALALLRRLVPGTFTGDDPFPHRRVVFRVSVNEISGRELGGG